MEDNINLNLGCVAYTATENGIEADWIYSSKGQVQKGIGKGIRIGKIKAENTFEGEFTISYVNQNGEKSPGLILKISFDSGYYNLSWHLEGKTVDIGIGTLSGDKLIAGYTAC